MRHCRHWLQFRGARPLWMSWASAARFSGIAGEWASSAAQLASSHLCRPGWAEVLVVLVLCALVGISCYCCGFVQGFVLGHLVSPQRASACASAVGAAVRQAAATVAPAGLRRLGAYNIRAA